MTSTGSQIKVVQDYSSAVISSSGNKTFHLYIINDRSHLYLAYFNPSGKQFSGVQEFEIDSKSNAGLSLQSYRSLLEKLPLSSTSIKSLTITFTDLPFTLLPEDYLPAASDLSGFTSLHNKFNGSSVLQVKTVPSLGTTFLYRLPSAHQQLKEEVNNVEFSFAGLGFLEGSAQTGPNTGSCVYIHAWEESIYIAAFQQKECLFFNTFHYHTSKDFLYYVMAVYDQLELNPESIPLKIAGTINKNSAIYRSLHKYIRHIDWETLPDNVRIDSNIKKEVPQHYYFSLLSSSLCE